VRAECGTHCQDSGVRYLSVRVEDDLYERVRAAAQQDRRSMNVWVTIALERAVEDQEQPPGKAQPRSRQRKNERE
jgi:predicted HicB family RNase H-like nuclease